MSRAQLIPTQPRIKYRHTLIFRVDSVEHRSSDDIALVCDPEAGIRSFITSCPDEFCLDADRAEAFGRLLIEGHGSQAQSGALEERLAIQIAGLRQRRHSQYDKGPYVVIERSGAVEPFTAMDVREFRDFVVYANGPSPEQTIREQGANQACALVMAIGFEADWAMSADKICDSVVFFRDDGKPIQTCMYSASFAINESPLLNEGSVERIEQRYRRLSADRSLTRILRLYVSSRDAQQGMLRSFLASWNALEILINSVFPDHQKELFEELKAGPHAECRAAYFDRLREVMKDKHRLIDKFAVIASRLCPADSESGLAKLQNAKKRRDQLSHGQDIDEKDLPVTDVQELVWKYLQLHLGHEFCPDVVQSRRREFFSGFRSLPEHF